MAEEGILGVGKLPPRTYAEFYQQNMAFDRVYTIVLALYSIDQEHEGQADGEELGRVVLLAAMQQLPTAYLILVIKHGQIRPTVQCFHWLEVFQPWMGMGGCAWDSQAFAFGGDLYNNVITTVNWNIALFAEVDDGAIRVASDDMLIE